MIDFDNGFRGRAVSARLISNCISYGPRPAPDALVEQHLTLSADGNAVLRGYCYGDGIDYLPQPQQTAVLRPEDARMLLDAVGSYFFQPQDDLFATDVGVWSLTLTSEPSK